METLCTTPLLPAGMEAHRRCGQPAASPCSCQGLTERSREGSCLTLAGNQQRRRSARPLERGAGGQSAPQAWVEVDAEETPPPREQGCYCRNSQRNSRSGLLWQRSRELSVTSL